MRMKYMDEDIAAGGVNKNTGNTSKSEDDIT